MSYILIILFLFGIFCLTLDDISRHFCVFFKFKQAIYERDKQNNFKNIHFISSIITILQ